MSQRDSGYERKERDCYETPEWVTEAVIDYIDTKRHVWEPAAGSGKMAKALHNAGMKVDASDIETGDDFLKKTEMPYGAAAIVTNPPYDQAQKFIEHALKLTEPKKGAVAMLLRTDYDHAKTRMHLFKHCKPFWCKLVLTKRIRWIEGSTGQPSFNHAWFIWDWQNRNSPTLAYD